MASFVCADYTLVDYAQIVGAIGSIVAIGFAWRSLTESTTVRKAAIRQSHLDYAETRLRAFERITILLGEMIFQTPDGKLRSRQEIYTIIVGNRLEEDLPVTFGLSKNRDDGLDAERNRAYDEAFALLSAHAKNVAFLRHVNEGPSEV